MSASDIAREALLELIYCARKVRHSAECNSERRTMLDRIHAAIIGAESAAELLRTGSAERKINEFVLSGGFIDATHVWHGKEEMEPIKHGGDVVSSIDAANKLILERVK